MALQHLVFFILSQAHVGVKEAERPDIKGRIQLKNFRKTPVKLLIEMDYFGEFVSATGKPEKKALNHFGSLNPKNQLVWNLTLKPGETRKLEFRYNIIVNR